MTEVDVSAFAALLDGFTDRAGALGVLVSHAKTSARAAEIMVETASNWEASEVVMTSELIANAPGLAAALEHAGLPVSPCTGPDHARDARLGAGYGRMALAETGSVLVKEATLEDRSIGMLANGHVLVVPSAHLEPGLDEAGPALRRLALDEPGMATLITGPSRTADIERVLTVGVQGPARVAVIFVDKLD